MREELLAAFREMEEESELIISEITLKAQWFGSLASSIQSTVTIKPDDHTTQEQIMLAVMECAQRAVAEMMQDIQDQADEIREKEDDDHEEFPPEDR